MSDSEVLETTTEAGTLVQPDPVFSNFSLPLRGVYYPLGFAVEIATNSPHVLVAAEESWTVFGKSFLSLQYGSSWRSYGWFTRMPTGSRLQRTRQSTYYCCRCQKLYYSDLNRGFAFAWLTQAAVENRAYLRYYFLEATALTLLDCLYLTPLHAACVEIEGRGVLLCGESGQASPRLHSPAPAMAGTFYRMTAALSSRSAKAAWSSAILTRCVFASQPWNFSQN